MKEDYTELIERFFQGDERAFALIVERSINFVYRFIYGMTGDSEVAEDLTQETFVRVWKSLTKFDTKKNFHTWTFTIARNVVIDWFRKRKDLQLSSFEGEEGGNPLIESLEDIEMLPDELFEKVQNEKDMKSLLQEIQPLYREVLILRYYEDLTFEEIGEVLGKPLHTVKSQHRRGLKQLRNILGRGLHQNITETRI